MFYGGEENNYRSKERTIYYFDILTTIKTLKASDFIQSQAKSSTATCNEAEH